MTKKAALLAALLIMISCILLPVSAAARGSDTAGQLLGGISVYKQNGSSTQQWINGELTDNAGVSGEWYIMALSQTGSYDFSKYQKALLAYLKNNHIASATSREKYALALICTGSNDSYITETLENSAGKQGLMSYIFALHIVNNGYTSGDITADKLISDILALQKTDGGFAVIGNYGDPDCSAMTLAALAPYYKTNSKVKTACEKALGFLSKAQQTSGAYTSFGNENCESTAQVLLALSSLGIDPCSDSRFIKSGHDIIDAMAGFALDSGGFEHIRGEGVNESATVQAFYCLTAYERFTKGKGAFFVFDKRAAQKRPDKPDKPKVTTTVTSKHSDTTDKKTTATKKDGTTVTQAKTTRKTSAVTAGGNEDTVRITTSVSGSENIGGNADISLKTVTSSGKSGSSSKTGTLTDKTQIVSEAVSGSSGDTASQTPDETYADTGLTTQISDTSDEPQETSSASDEQADESEVSVQKKTGSVKLYIYIGIGSAAVIVCAVLFIRGRRNIKSYILIIVIGGALCAGTAFADIETKEEHFAPNDSSSHSESTIEVTMSVDCLTIMGLADNLPDDGYIIPTQKVTVSEGDTAYDLLERLAKENGILLDIKGSDEMIYVSGIAGIYEFDHGELSGWMYYVNGSAPSVNSSQYTLKDGDVVEWRYTKEIGRDIDT